MNNRVRAEILVDRLNKTIGLTGDVTWNTPRAFLLESYMPGNRRIYQLNRNTDDVHGGQSNIFSGTAPEVATYVTAMLDGLRLAGENK